MKNEPGKRKATLSLERLGMLEIVEPISSSSSSGDDKKWICKDRNNVIYYVKVARKRQGGRWYEPETECVASRLAELLGVDCVKYFLDMVKCTGEVVSVSRKYMPEIDRVSLYAAIGEYSGLYGVERYNYIIKRFPSIKYNLNKMLMFDYIIGNTDRHLKNIEIMSVKNTTCMAPVFDNGKALFSEESENVIRLCLSCRGNYVHSKPFLNPHNNQIELVRRDARLNKVNKVAVYRTVNEYFKNERARLINKWLIMRLSELELLE